MSTPSAFYRPAQLISARGSSRLGAPLLACCRRRQFSRPYAALATVDASEGAADVVAAPALSAACSRLRTVKDSLRDDFGGDPVWLKRLNDAETALSTSQRPTIGVFGDQYSSYHDLVTALLRDPLTDTKDSRKTLQQRYSDSSADALRFSPSDDPARTPLSIQTPSSWLRKIDSDVLEINGAGLGSRPGSSAADIVDQFLRTDISLLVLDSRYLLSPPLVSSLLPTLAAKGRLILVVNGTLASGHSADSIRVEIANQYRACAPTQNEPPPPVLFVSSDRALTAFDCLSDALPDDQPQTSRLQSIEAFQRDHQASNLGGLQTGIATLVSALPPGHALRDDKVMTVSRLALAYMKSLAQLDHDANRSAQSLVAQLRLSADRAGVEAKQLSVVSRGIEGGLVEGGVQHALAVTEGQIRSRFLTRWTWLNMILRARADDVGEELESLLLRSFGRDLETQLVFETGKLSQIQHTLSGETDVILRKLSKSGGISKPLSSHILMNHLSTLALSIPPFEASDLLTPIRLRRQQLIEESVPRLQLSARRALATSIGISASCTAASWAACMPPLEVLSGSTAIGTGALGCVVALALGQKWWERAQKRFWADWHRVTSMLRGDLQASLEENINTRLVAKPIAAANGLQDVIARREQRLEALAVRIESMREQL